ncbi:Laminin subunit alpha-1 [Operophtera brumata]|uniref:Laminin subunit alpha-1 n=1 Tax=Operophtera brumata TaxID=104452 RepID=A0A0L7L9H8_OPEBR|nr:Laminin subunit alpha-1 [Operophtera brumata]
MGLAPIYWRGIVCDVCEGPDGSPSRRHPPAHANDGDPGTWWQSPSLAAGEQFQHVELVAALPDVSRPSYFRI